MQVFHHGMSEFRAGALRIEIFVAEDERPAVLESALGGGPERARVSNVEQTRGRGRKTAAVFGESGGHEGIVRESASSSLVSGAGQKSVKGIGQQLIERTDEHVCRKRLAVTVDANALHAAVARAFDAGDSVFDDNAASG